MRKIIGSAAATAMASVLLVAGPQAPAATSEPALDACARMVRVPGEYGRERPEAKGPGQAVVEPDAVAACRKALDADPESPRAMLLLAFAILYPTSLYFPDRKEEPPQEAWSLLSRSAEREHPSAMFVMAQIVESGRFPGMDNAGVAWRMALQLYRKAAAGGNPAAMLRLAGEYSAFGGGMLRGGQTGSDREELVTAMDWANKAVAAGHPRAEILLARIVLASAAATEDEQHAATSGLSRRMDGGDCEAFWALGTHLFKRGEQKSQGGAQAANPEALRLIRVAADHGHYGASRLMAALYGPDGVYKPDPAEAQAWTKKAQDARTSGQTTGQGCKG
jgi:TPR repeat protein